MSQYQPRNICSSTKLDDQVQVTVPEAKRKFLKDLLVSASKADDVLAVEVEPFRLLDLRFATGAARQDIRLCCQAEVYSGSSLSRAPESYQSQQTASPGVLAHLLCRERLLGSLQDHDA